MCTHTYTRHIHTYIYESTSQITVNEVKIVLASNRPKTPYFFLPQLHATHELDFCYNFDSNFISFFHFFIWNTEHVQHARKVCNKMHKLQIRMKK